MSDDRSDEAWMEVALAGAAAAAARGEVPVGALIVDGDGRLLGRGYNLRESAGDPTAHAEIVALREAAAARGTWRLDGTTCYATLEPCPMCAGALVNARVSRLVYGCPDPKAGAVDTLYSLCTDGRLNHRLEVTSGVLAERCAAALSEFFAALRRADRPAKPGR